MQKIMNRSTQRGFTLVELLVVIGIIAVLIGILLPTLNSVRRTSNLAKCGSNLSQTTKGALVYAASNKGYFPYGWLPLGYNYTATPGPNGTTYAWSGGYVGWTAWFALINSSNQGAKNAPPYVSDSRDTRFPVTPSNSFRAGYKLPDFFRCSVVTGSDFQQQVHYYHNPSVFIHPVMEIRTAAATTFVVGGRRVLGVPMLQRTTADMTPETALFWDAPLMAGMGPEFTIPWFGDSSNESPPGLGAAVFASLIDSWESPDDLRLNENGVANPGIRFLFKGRDHTASLSASQQEIRSFDQPILYPTDAEFQLYASFGGAGKSLNSDVGANTFLGAQIGNVRYRHGNNDQAQVGFADGSVRTVTLNRKRTFGGGMYYSSDFKRRYLMTLPPSTAIYRTPP